MGGGERELLEAIGRAAQAQVAVLYREIQGGWRCASWQAPQFAALLADWEPPADPPPGIFPAEAGAVVCLTDPLAGLINLPAANDGQAALGVQEGAALHLRRAHGFGPSVLWLGLKQAADLDQLQGLARLAEQLLAPHLSLMQDCLDFLPGVFVVVAMDGTVLYCNERIRELGYAPEEVIGNPGIMLFAPGERERLRAELERRPQIGRHEALMRSRSGTYMMVDMMLAVAFDEQQQPKYIISIGRNLQEVRQREHQRRLEAVGSLVSGVAHELNNPLMTVLGNAEMMASMKLPETAHRRAERVLSGARRCQEVVNELLRMKRRSTSTRQEIDVEQLVSRSLKRVREEQDWSQVAVGFLPPAAQLLIMGDSAELEQALVNVLKNALQAAAEAAAPAISVRVVRLDGFAQICIHDNGPGVSQEVFDRAFEPFFTTREIGSGRGLGLSTALAILQEHGGFIDLRAGSEGTEALITIPIEIFEPRQTE